MTLPIEHNVSDTPLAPPPRRRRRGVDRLWAIRGKSSKTEFAVFAIAGLLVPLAGWMALSHSGILPKLFMPDPIRVIARFWVWITREGFGQDMQVSLLRVSMGFLLALLLALPLGLLAGTFRDGTPIFLQLWEAPLALLRDGAPLHADIVVSGAHAVLVLFDASEDESSGFAALASVDAVRDAVETRLLQVSRACESKCVCPCDGV